MSGLGHRLPPSSPNSVFEAALHISEEALFEGVLEAIEVGGGQIVTVTVTVSVGTKLLLPVQLGGGQLPQLIDPDLLAFTVAFDVPCAETTALEVDQRVVVETFHV